MYRLESYGFWKQVKPEPFKYDANYEKSQSSNIEMCWLRLGYLSSFFSHDEMKQMTVVDIGAGNGSFVRAANSFFKNVYPYDLVGDSISEVTLFDVPWDVIVLSDVLEHMPDIDWIFRLKWRYMYLSFPETPLVRNEDELRAWHHYKPNEHIWCLNKDGVCHWLEKNGCKIKDFSNFEDFIRVRWDSGKPNITTLFVERQENEP